jgi:hypothetical protein
LPAQTLHFNGVEPQLEGKIYRATISQSIIKTDGKLNSCPVANGLIRTHHVGHKLCNGLGLGFGVTGIKHHTVKPIGKQFKQICQGIWFYGFGITLVIFNDEMSNELLT